MTAANIEDPNILHADRPITNKADDKLGRDKFAEHVANQIRQAPHGSSFVMGIVGPWGSGKTTILNFTKAELDGEASLYFIEFNPWLFSGHKELVAHFFHELAAQIRDEDRADWRNIWRGFEGYSRLLRPLRAVPGAPTSSSDTEHEPSLLKQKRLLATALAESKQRLVVVIDDVDRLEDEEIRDVMRLVRLLADFPNMIYILAYDQKRVVEALGGKDNEERGRAYLEKIVQVVHHVPPFRQWQVTEILEDAIGKLRVHLGQPPLPPAFRYNILRPIKPLFHGYRDIYRYLNSLRPTLIAVGDEVCLSDVCQIEALRVLAPNVFEVICQNREMFTERDSWDHNFQENRSKVVLELFDSWGEQKSTYVPICKSLFPAVSHVGGGPSNLYAAREREWRREHKVACRERFDIYLDRALPPGTISNQIMRDFLQQCSDETALNVLLDRLTRAEFDNLINRMPDHEDEIEVDEECTALKVLVARIQQTFELSDMYVAGSAYGRLKNCVVPLLRRVPEKKRLAIGERELQATTTLSARNVLTAVITETDLLEPASKEKLIANLAARVLAEQPETLAREPQLGFLMGWVRTARPGAEQPKWRELIADDRTGAMALSNLLSVGIDSRSHAIPWWDDLETAVGKEELVERIREIAARRDEFGLNERAKLALDVALQYPKRPPKQESADTTAKAIDLQQNPTRDSEKDSVEDITSTPESVHPD